MNRKVIIAVIAILTLAVVAAFAWSAVTNVQKVNGESATPEQKRQTAIEEAREFVPAGNCTVVITPAKHASTGAVFTFNTGCLPEGWERYSSLGTSSDN